MGLPAEPPLVVRFGRRHAPPLDVGVEVAREKVARVRFGRVAHPRVQLNARRQGELTRARRAVDPPRGTRGLGGLREGKEGPFCFDVFVKRGACHVVFQGLPHHALGKDNVALGVAFGRALEVVHIKQHVDAFLPALPVGHEIRPHRQGVALHHQQVRVVVQFLVEGGDVANAVEGDDVFLGG